MGDNFVSLLDHGYVKVVETWGSDERIIEAARMSTDKGFQGWGGLCGVCKGSGGTGEMPCTRCGGKGELPVGDEKLLAYLWKNKHLTPFEMAGAVFEVQAPIFVYRQWHRHRTQSYNELSARYTVMPDLFYVPSAERLRSSAEKSSNKQAAGKGALTTDPDWLQRDILRAYHFSFITYQELLARGVSSELARVVLPVGQYSRMRASANLRNWLHFVSLRSDEHAQWEIRQYSDSVRDLLALAFPRTLGLFMQNV